MVKITIDHEWVAGFIMWFLRWVSNWTLMRTTKLREKIESTEDNLKTERIERKHHKNHNTNFFAGLMLT